MRNLIRLVFTLAIFGSCSKKVQNTIPDPPEGNYEVIFYDQDNNIVLTRKGNAFHMNMTSMGTQIRLDDPSLTQMLSPDPNDIVYIIFQLDHKLSSPGTVNTSKFDGFVSQLKYVPDWEYGTKTAELKITEVAQNKIRGEFTITIASENNPNPKWGKRITIKGKFFARCGGYGC